MGTNIKKKATVKNMCIVTQVNQKCCRAIMNKADETLLDDFDFNFEEMTTKDLAMEMVNLLSTLLLNKTLKVDKSGKKPKNVFTIDKIYGILHDKDKVEIWNENLDSNVINLKEPHIHLIIGFTDARYTVDEIADMVGLEPQFIEVGRGRYALDNLLSYLTHVKYQHKHQYSADEVVTLKGKDYLEIYNERYNSWFNSRGLINKKNAAATLDVLTELVLTGRVTKEQVLLTDEYFEVYSRHSRVIDDAFNAYGERKAMKTLRALKNGDCKLSVYYITGKSGSGKSRYATKLIDNIKNRVKETTGERWDVCNAASTNPLDDYRGEEILFMDDVRGNAMSASDWLKLLDPYVHTPNSARYKNKQAAVRVIIITASINALEFFYYSKGAGGGSARSEALDQFMRRLQSIIKVFNLDDVKDENGVSLPCIERYKIKKEPYPRNEIVAYSNDNLPIKAELNYLPYKDEKHPTDYNKSITDLTCEILELNNIEI